MKRYHDKRLKGDRLHPGDLVLWYLGKIDGKRKNLTIGWAGPYQIEQIYENGSVQLKDLEGLQLPEKVNIGKLKKYWIQDKERANEMKPDSPNGNAFEERPGKTVSQEVLNGKRESAQEKVQEEEQPAQYEGRMTRLKAKQNQMEPQVKQIQAEVSKAAKGRGPLKCEKKPRRVRTIIITVFIFIIGLWVIAKMM